MKLKMEVAYIPIFSDGSEGRRQTCILEAECRGRRAIDVARSYWAEHFPNDHDRIEAARWMV